MVFVQGSGLFVSFSHIGHWYSADRRVLRKLNLSGCRTADCMALFRPLRPVLWVSLRREWPLLCAIFEAWGGHC